MPDHYLIPWFSHQTIKEYLNKGKTNQGLLLYRYLNKENIDKNLQVKVLETINEKADKTMLKALHARQEADLAQWRTQFGTERVCSGSLELVDRMIVGMGIPSSFENGLLLHWVHGIPFINGEALKGTARSFAKETLNTNDESAKNEFRDIFGTVEKEEKDSKVVKRGKVFFFDALPEPTQEFFDVDIITCHYTKYYTGEPPEEPGDWHMPIPVSFLCVRAGLVFRFAVASQEDRFAQRAWQWLQDGLYQRGIGAKKRIGYGHFLPLIQGAHCQPETRPQSEFSRFMERLGAINDNHLPGMASQLVAELEALPNPADKTVAAHALGKRIDKSILRRKADKPWVQTLKILCEEKPS